MPRARYMMASSQRASAAQIGILVTASSSSSSSSSAPSSSASSTTPAATSTASCTQSSSSGKSVTRSVPAILSRKRKLDQADMDLSQFFSATVSSASSSQKSGILPMEENAAIVITSSSSSDDTSDEDDDCMVISENTQPSMVVQHQQQNGPPRRTLSQSSRIPLSTLQTTSSRQQQQQYIPSEHSILKQQQQPQQIHMPPRTAWSSPAALPSSSSTAPVPKPKNNEGTPPSAKKLKLRQSWSQFREFIRTTSSMSLSASASEANPLPRLDWVDRRDLWELVRKKETGMYSRRAQTTAQVFARHPAIQERMRAVLFDWLIEVCEVYRLHRETFYLATDFIDRYLAKTEDVPKTRLQLLGVTCLFVASKIEEIYPPKLGEFTYVTDGACSDEEILQMELVVLKELNWGLSPMTPNAWVKLFMQVANTDQRAAAAGSFLAPPQYTGLPFCRVMQLLDICILDAGSLRYSYSVLAATALGIVMGDRALAAAVSGHDWTSFSTLGECEEWMRHFHSALRQECPTLVPRTFPNIPLDDAHNVQSHATDMRVLDVARERLRKAEAQRQLEREIMAAQAEEAAARDRLSPEISTTALLSAHAQLVEMTPPEESGDVRAAALSTPTMQKHPLASTSSSSDPSTVFLSPETPTTNMVQQQQPASKKTLTYPMVRQ